MTNQPVDPKLQQSVREIYNILTKLQFPALSQADDSDSEDGNNLSFKKINQTIGKYLYGNESHLQLIEWLILKFNSNLLSKQKCTKQERIQKIEAALSHLGLLPISKHSRNIDYGKYVQGLLSLQSSVTSILKLCLLIKQGIQNRKRQKAETKFCGFLKDLVQNKNLLVNKKYDPFPLTLPQQFSDLSEAEFNALYEQRSNRFVKNAEPQLKEIEDEGFFTETSAQAKLRYKTTLSQLSHTIELYSGAQIEPQKQQIQTIKLLKVDCQFVNSLRNFNKMTNIPTEEKTHFSSTLKTIKVILDSI